MSTPFFTTTLLHWHTTIERAMPWKNTRNPYKIWLSEVILQQTRVAQGLPYYEKFIKKYASIHDLANAPLDDVLKLWEGLGYYSRARNMHATAKYVAVELGGTFPNSYDGLLQLKGIGAYTAAAIASFAFQLPHAVVDGNVLRVLSRFFAVREPIDIASTHTLITLLANQLLGASPPDLFNQAIMDFGSLVCTPALPKNDCQHCVLRAECKSVQLNIQHQLPFKSKKTKVTELYFRYYIIKYKNKYHVQQRNETGIWQGLYEFYLIELTNKRQLHKEEKTALLRLLTLLETTAGEVSIATIKTDIIHKLSHRTIHASVVLIDCKTMPSSELFTFKTKQEIQKLSFPRMLTDLVAALS